MQDRRECDVLVIGGGPAGSTIAGLLAQKRRHVVVLEKDRFPRFHIGELLLPLNLPFFEQLGVADEVERIGVYKPGAEVISDDTVRRRHSVLTVIRICASITAITSDAPSSTNCCSTIAAASAQP